jgi:uncharacterized protein (DUF2147 family)
MRILKNCRPSAITSLAAAILLTAGFGPAAAGDPTGDWLVADGVAKVRVAECNGAMWGAISWEKQPGLDSNNADPAKQSRPTLGMPLLFDMKKKSDEDLWEGQVYDAKTTGRLQQASIRLLSPDKLEIKGCMLGILCGGETWTRASAPIPSSPSNNLAATPAAAKGAPKAGMAKTTPPKHQGKTTGQKTVAPAAAATAAPADPVGDICLLPDIAGAAHEGGLK